MDLMNILSNRINKPPIFNEEIKAEYESGDIYDLIIGSMDVNGMGWFMVSRLPLSKLIILNGTTLIKLSGKYSEFGIGYALELEDKYSYIPKEWIGLRIKYVVWT